MHPGSLCGSTSGLLTDARSLERKSQGTLHDARRARRGYLSERRARLVTARVKPRRSVDAGILGVVEAVISFPSQLEISLLAVDREFLRQRQVPVVHTRVSDIVLTGVTRIVQSG